MNRHTSFVWVVTGAVLIFGGCAAGRSVSPLPTEIQVERPYETVSITSLKPSSQMTAEDDVVQWIEYGTYLYDEGRYREAGDLFMSAVARFESEDGVFEREMSLAAATSYLRLGPEGRDLVLQALSAYHAQGDGGFPQDTERILLVIEELLNGRITAAEQSAMWSLLPPEIRQYLRKD